jgi:hypothetical protein
MHPCFASAAQISQSVKREPYEPPADTPQPRTHEICAKPSAPQVHSEGVKPFVQPDTEAKSQQHEVGAKPVFLRLIDERVGDADPSPPYQMYIPSGSNATDPTRVLSLSLCPIDGSKMHPCGSTRLAWVCEAYGHQFDVVGGMPMVVTSLVGEEKLHPRSLTRFPTCDKGGF